MVLKLYNTLTRKKQVFKPLKEGEVKLYGCGPTVYFYQHIGNIRRYVFEDILVRVLGFDGFKVNHIINVTDVGHLTSDADEGEDKMEKSIKKEGRTAEEIAKFYFEAFDNDFKKMNIMQPTRWTWATKHIQEMITLVQTLIDKGYTYETSDGIYFDTSKLKDYGKLARLDKENLKAGARIDLGEKKNKTDFALWKFSEKPGMRQQEWEAFGKMGFPGWHIECSAMSSKYLGDHFDIHTGGIDHIPIHHTNEIAQSEAAFGKKPWVNFWMHSAFLTLRGEKVSKSKGGGYNPLHYRLMCLLTHYRSSLEFSLENLTAAKNGYESLKNKIANISPNQLGAGANVDGKKYLDEFQKAIDDDLNMPKALAVLQKLLKDDKVSGKSKLELVEKMDSVFGLDLLKKEKVDVPEEVRKLAEERWKAKKMKDWKSADEARDKVKALGFVINDTLEGYEIKKA
jgi:cysteinyl-tRNA synthetase